MKRIAACLVSIVFALPAFAQDAQEAREEIDCSLVENAELPECLNLPANRDLPPITNFAPLIAPFLGAAVVGGLVGGGGGSSTPSTNTN